MPDKDANKTWNKWACHWEGAGSLEFTTYLWYASWQFSCFFKNDLCMVVVGLCCCVGFSPAVASGGCSLVVALGLLIALASLSAEPGSRDCRLQWLWFPGFESRGSAVVVHGLRCSAPCGILHSRDWTGVSCLTGRFFTTEPPGRSQLSTFICHFGRWNENPMWCISHGMKLWHGEIQDIGSVF